MDTAVFIAWTEPILLPNIPEKSAIVMDNATFHQGQDMQNMIEDSGYTLLYLPPYSPDLNPSETTWAHAQHIRGTTNGSLNELFTRYSLQSFYNALAIFANSSYSDIHFVKVLDLGMTKNYNFRIIA